MSSPLFSDTIQTLSGVVDWIRNAAAQVQGMFSDVDFTILYSWLPSDIQGVITACIAVLLLLAIFGLLRRILFFLG